MFYVTILVDGVELLIFLNSDDVYNLEKVTNLTDKSLTSRSLGKQQTDLTSEISTKLTFNNYCNVFIQKDGKQSKYEEIAQSSTTQR